MVSRTVREVRVNLRLSKSINDRIEHVAEAAGQSHSVIAALAIAAGLRTLENTLLQPNAELLGVLASKMLQQANSDVDEQLAVAASEIASKGSVPV